MKLISPFLCVFCLLSSESLARDDERDELIAKAQASVAAAAEKVKDDSSRPRFHILPPANWLNDPNGLLYHKGFYHVFYQHNPYGDEWGNMHWGHVRSKDLAHWEHLPIALWPSKSKGEEHVFSGSAWVRKDGTPILFYTSIGANRLPEQWAAIPEDDDLIKWKKHPANPILTEAIHGDTKIHEWRDPYLFEVNGVVHMVCGGNTNASKGGEGVVCVYRAENDELTQWKYLGVLFKHPDAEVKNVECPIFFKLDGRWVLITSQGQPVDWFVGDLDEKALRFTPKSRGKVDYGQVYAPSVLVQGVERPILWCWINGMPGGKGWRHCLTLPRELSIDDQGRLKQDVRIDRLASLGRQPQQAANEVVVATGKVPGLFAVAEGLGGLVFARVEPVSPKVFELKLEQPANGGHARSIRYDFKTGALAFEGTEAKVPLATDGTLNFAVFADRSIVEVWADEGRVWITKVVEAPSEGLGISTSTTGGSVKLTVHLWPLGSIWTKPTK